MSYITKVEYVPLNNNQTDRNVPTADAAKQFVETLNYNLPFNGSVTSLVPVQENGTTIGFIVTFTAE